MSKGLVAAVLLMPLVRFEGAAFSGAAILALGLIGHWKPALTAAALIVISLGAYGAMMSHLGLPVLPSSVLTKSPVAEAIADSQGGSSSPSSETCVAPF